MNSVALPWNQCVPALGQDASDMGETKAVRAAVIAMFRLGLDVGIALSGYRADAWRRQGGITARSGHRRSPRAGAYGRRRAAAPPVRPHVPEEPLQGSIARNRRAFPALAAGSLQRRPRCRMQCPRLRAARRIARFAAAATDETRTAIGIGMWTRPDSRPTGRRAMTPPLSRRSQLLPVPAAAVDAAPAGSRVCTAPMISSTSPGSRATQVV